MSRWFMVEQDPFTFKQELFVFEQDSSELKQDPFIASEDVDPVPFINLDSDEEEEDPALAWARADYHATEQARQSAEQARAAQYAEDLQKALTQSLADQEGEIKGNGKAPMEVEGKGKG